MTKIISLSDAAYAKLKAAKLHGESFSDVAMRLSEQKPLSQFLGCWPGNRDEVERIKRVLAHDRKKSKTREVIF